MLTLVVQVVVVVLGVVAGAIWPRQPSIVTGETLVNVVTGALLYPVRYALGLGVIALLGWFPGSSAAPEPLAPLAGTLPLVDVGTLGHPVAQVLFCFLLLDFSRYWLHYADHRVSWLWTFHRVHHSAEHIDSTLGFRMHVVDFLQLTGLILALFGVLFDIRAFEPWTLPVALSVGIVADAIEHANVRFPLDTWWRRAWFRVFNTPLFHSWHHVRDATLCDGNYANALPLWDRLFGTEVTRPAPPTEYGLTPDQRLERTVLGLQALRRPVPGPPP